MTGGAGWQNLERRVAAYFERHGYRATTNVKVTGRSGLVHELDVLAERSDAAGTHRVAVECKAWRSPVEKDVVYKLERVVQDAGLSKGVLVSVGGVYAGARVAAEQANIDVWGPDEVRHHLGDEALAGLPLAVPDRALGVTAAVSRGHAEREVMRARRGFAGIGGEGLVSLDLVWLPAYELRLAITWIRPGLVRGREEVFRRWNLYEALTGRLVGEQDSPCQFEDMSLGGAVLRPQRSVAQVVGDMRKTLAKHRAAKSDAAQVARKVAYNAIGLRGATREFAVEAEASVFVPFFVGRLRRKASERLIAVHAGTGSRSEAVEHALHDKVDLVLRAIEQPAAAPRPAPGGFPVAPNPSTAPPTCACGAAMVLRRRRADGGGFWGCSTFPRCRHTVPLGGQDE